MNTSNRKRRGAARTITAINAALLMSACATTGATLGSGVADRLIDEPPYYAGARRVGSEGIAHLPITYQRGAIQPPSFEPHSRPGTPIAGILSEMNIYLDNLGVSTPLDPREPVGLPAPDVRFSCEADGMGDCDSDSDDVAIQGKPWMLLAVGRPSSEWTATVAGVNDGYRCPTSIG
jgi:hypothetical protein